MTIKEQPKLEIIVAFGNYVPGKGYPIGKSGKLPWHFPSDLKWFKKMTEGNIVIMGRKTFEAIGLNALPNRLNIVISSTLEYAPGVTIFKSLENALKALQIESNLSRRIDGKKVFLIGGSRLFEEALEKNLVSAIHIDYLAVNADDADTFFPDFHKYGKWDEDENGPVEVEHRKAYAITFFKKESNDEIDTDKR